VLEIDGSAGGGQLVRTALALSAVTGESFHITGVRAERPSPGLRPQHQAAVRLLASLTDADVSGAEVGSASFSFEPGAVEAGAHDVDIGTAGSITLLFDAVLPLATVADGPLVIQARGGTDVRWAPTLDYHRLVKLPLLRRHGLAVALDVERRGFYPAGGGEATLRLWPSTVRPLDLPTPRDPATAQVFSVASADLADRDVAPRQATAAETALDAADVAVREQRAASVDSVSTGSVIAVRLDRGQAIAGADALGEQGTPAETVAERAVDRLAPMIESGATVDEHLADQLLPFVGLTGGRYSVPTVSEHIWTNTTVLERFGTPVSVQDDGERAVVSGVGDSAT